MTDEIVAADRRNFPRGPSRRIGRHLVAWLVVILIAAVAADAGLRLRKWAWDATAGGHFQFDVRNGWRWGSQADRDGLFWFYEDVVADAENRRGRLNDYTPLRLTVMTLWAGWTKAHFPGANGWRDEYAFTAPVLRVNAVAEGASAILVFFIVRLLRVRQTRAALESATPRQSWRTFFRSRRARPPLHDANTARILDVGDLATRTEEPTPGPSSLSTLPAAGEPAGFGAGHYASIHSDRTIASASLPPPARPGVTCGLVSGLFGAMLLWFNPAVIWDAHCWPQWDMWLMPFFLAAVLAACTNAWFVAGMCLVTGAFFKGQILLVAPLLLLWPVFGGRIGAAYRLLCGGAFAAAAIALPWMLPATEWASVTWSSINLVPWKLTPVWEWLVLMTIAILVVSPAVWVRRLWWPWPWPIAMAVTALMLAWPWGALRPTETKLLGLLPLVLVIAQGALLPRMRPAGYALALAAMVMLTIPLFGSNVEWFNLGFVHGATQFEQRLSLSGWNVPAMIVEYLRWPNDSRQLVAVPGLMTINENLLWLTDPPWLRAAGQPPAVATGTVQLDTVLKSLYFAILIVCALAASVHARRRDTRLLATFVAPWLWFFLLLPQMHERYPVWAAAAAALLVGQSVGLALLGVIVSVIGMAGMMEVQFSAAPDFAPQTLELLRRLNPHPAWAMIVVALIWLYVAVAPRRKSDASAG